MDLKKLTDKQLEKLAGDISREKASREKRKKSEARKAAEMAAKKHGFKLSDLLGAAPGPAAKPKKAPAAPKYRNPADGSQTWSGRGRQPQWFKDAIAAGKSPDDLAI